MTTTLDTQPAPPEPSPSFAARLRGGILRWLGRFHPVGLAVALLFYCWSLSPSLLPRPWYLQGVATGISVITGYGIGVLLAWIVRKCGFETNWSATVKKVGWYLLAAVAVVVVPTFLVLGSWWQDISRELVGMEPGSSWDYPGVLLVAVVVTLLLLVIGRGLRHVAQWVTGLVVRVLPAPWRAS